MLVSIWRHAEAEPGSPDRERVLTERGHRDLDKGAPGFVAELQRRGLDKPGRILFSPWRRTSQTAQAIAAPLDTPELKPLDALIPGADPIAVDAALQTLTEEAIHIVLVSHQPLVSDVVDHWLGTQGQVPAFAPGAYAVIELPVAAAGCGSLLWWCSPPEYRV